jgi:hypothetical protein
MPAPHSPDGFEERGGCQWSSQRERRFEVGMRQRSGAAGGVLAVKQERYVRLISQGVGNS